MRRSGGVDGLQPDEAADAVVDVHHEIAGREARHLGDEVLRALGLALGAHETVAEDVLLADDGEVIGLEAVLQPPDDERRLVAGERRDMGETRNRLRLRQAMVGKHMAETLARTLRPGSEHHMLARLLQLAHVAHGDVEDVRRLVRPLGGEAAPLPATDIDHEPSARLRLGKGRQPDNRFFPPLCGPCARTKIARGRRPGLLGLAADDRLVEGGLAGIVIIGDLRETLARRVIGERVEDEGHARQIGEQRVEVVVEQRQPVLDAGMAPPLAHRLVERVVPRRRAEGRHIALAEAAHGLGGELQFAHRHEVERAQLVRGALRLGIEGPDRFERVAEEVETQRLRHARGIEVDDAAAHRIFARVTHGAGAQEAVDLEPADERLHVHDIAGRGRERLGGDAGDGRHALQDGVDRREQDARLVLSRPRAGEPGERRHAPRGHGGVGRHPVVGLAVPGGKGKDIDLRRNERQRRLHRRHALAVAGHVHERRRPLLAFGEGACEIGRDDGVEPVGHARDGEAFGPLQGLDGAFELHGILG